ncbi:MAG TPA: hypothetical protein VFV08_10095, partial [Puia sp.]|nr:hypothetical protein [Puia sp.]
MGKHCPCLILAILLFKANVIFSQQKQNVYELKKQLTEARADTVRFRILDLIATDYLWYADQTDSAFSYASAEMEMAGKLNQPLYTAEAYLNSGWWFTSTAAFGTAIELFTKARHLAEENHFNTILVKAYQALCVSYSSLG